MVPTADCQEKELLAGRRAAERAQGERAQAEQARIDAQRRDGSVSSSIVVRHRTLFAAQEANHNLPRLTLPARWQ